MIENDERRRQRRLVVVLLRQTVSIEAPRLDADVLHRLERVAATTDYNHVTSQTLGSPAITDKIAATAQTVRRTCYFLQNCSCGKYFNTKWLLMFKPRSLDNKSCQKYQYDPANGNKPITDLL